MKYKKTVFLLVMAVLCVANWYFSNFGAVSNPDSYVFLSEKEIADWLLNEGSNYNGAREVLVVYTIPVILGIWYLTESERPAYLIRFPNRKSYKAGDLRCLLLASCMFSAAHELIQYIFMSLCMSREVIGKVHLPLYCLIAFVLHIILYVQTGLVWHILTDVFRSRLAGLFGAFGINFMQYLIMAYSDLWVPGKDSTAAYTYIDGDYTLGELFLVLTRGILVVALLCAICMMIFEKKDLMRDEKK